MTIARIGIILAAILLAQPVLSQGLVFQGNNLIDREHDKDVSNGSIGEGLRALQDRNPAIIIDRIITLNRSRDGHFYADVMVNGVNVNFLVDTGATNIALSEGDARRIGIDMFYLNFSMRAETASGIIKIAPTKLRSIILGETKNYDFPAFVLEGAAVNSLLGMSYLSQFAQIEINGNKMVLHP